MDKLIVRLLVNIVLLIIFITLYGGLIIPWIFKKFSSNGKDYLLVALYCNHNNSIKLLSDSYIAELNNSNNKCQVNNNNYTFYYALINNENGKIKNYNREEFGGYANYYCMENIYLDLPTLIGNCAKASNRKQPQYNDCVLGIITNITKYNDDGLINTNDGNSITTTTNNATNFELECQPPNNNSLSKLYYCSLALLNMIKLHNSNTNANVWLNINCHSYPIINLNDLEMHKTYGMIYPMILLVLTGFSVELLGNLGSRILTNNINEFFDNHDDDNDEVDQDDGEIIHVDRIHSRRG